MAAPIVDAITTVPNRANANNTASFSNDVDTFFSEVEGFQTQINALGEFVNDKAAQAAGNASNAATSALEAEDSALAAVGAANYKGKWEGKTSAGTIGESYSYAGSDIYALNVNLANLSTSVPSTTNTDWQLINALDFTPDATPLIDLEFDSETYTVYDGFGAGFAQKPLADIATHTRSTSGTGIAGNLSLATASANVPRIVFDPDTGERLGYLAEEQMVNLLTNPNDFSLWAGSATVGDYSTINGYSVVSIDDSSTTLNNARTQAITLPADSNVSLSFVAKYNNSLTTSVTLQGPSMTSAVGGIINWDSNEVPSSLYFTIKSIGSGLYEFTATGSTNATGGTSSVFYWPAGFATGGVSTGATFFGNPQVEVGAYSTSFTVGTRTRDSMSRTLTGNELNRSAFSLYWHGIFPVSFATGSATNSVIAGLTDGTYANGICISGQAASSNIRFHARSSSGDVALTRIIESASGEYKILFSIDRSTSTLSVFVNGAKIAVPSGSIFSALDFNTLTTMELVKGWLGNNFGSATTKNLRLFNNSFSDTDGKKVTRL